MSTKFTLAGVPRELYDDLEQLLAKHGLSDVLAALSETFFNAASNAGIPEPEFVPFVEKVDSACNYCEKKIDPLKRNLHLAKVPKE